MNSDQITEYTKCMLGMLIDRCPRLEDLQLFLNRAGLAQVIRRLMNQGRWPMLKRLTLACMFLEPDENTLDFLVAHPTLECIHISNLRNIRSLYRIGNAPELRALGYVKLSALKPAIVLQNAFQRLEYLSLDMTHVRASPRSDIHILAHVPTLRFLSLEGVDFPPTLMEVIAQAVPQLERLHFEAPESRKASVILSDVDGVSIPVVPQLFVVAHHNNAQIFSDYIVKLKPFRHLTHLSQYIHWNTCSSSTDAVTTNFVVRCLANACPTLNYLSLNTLNHGNHTWMTIDRDEKGAYFRRHLVERKSDVRVESWGGFFVGPA